MIISLKQEGQNRSFLWIWELWIWEWKFCSNVLSHMPKMATMPIHTKNFKKKRRKKKEKKSLELKTDDLDGFSTHVLPKGNLVYCIWHSSTTKFIQMMILVWPWSILVQGQIWLCLYRKKWKQWLFQKPFRFCFETCTN